MVLILMAVDDVEKRCYHRKHRYSMQPEAYFSGSETGIHFFPLPADAEGIGVNSEKTGAEGKNYRQMTNCSCAHEG
jgi:hypothetical protein